MSIRISFVARLDNTVRVTIIENNQDFRIGSGSQEECDVQLADRQISRCHAVLRCDPDKNYLTVEDVSENGCLLNSRFIHRSKVRIPVLFSVLQIGEYLFWFSHPHTLPSGRSHREFLNQLREGTGPGSESNRGEGSCSRRALVRYLLRIILPHEEGFQAFCIDHCEKVAMQFEPNMTRTNKENLLLDRVEPERILELLHSTDATIEQRSLLRCVRERWQRQSDLLGGG